ncbi:U3 small nucleolar RNA-associated protein 24 [Nematocida homosporus]|uniref:U3 small nucleolar RNA-associated protein 24 n=1 Tax=Nematocida homosporus TaxID=1912981 RepID=UPI00221FF790|nr:U3 small nucleolar RNA-associated protein 24 [Nematocida homosporus]KAI5186755.1 U3 small nucleolar RNA-associated protein 24 [Nematocida homosporus]
MGKNRTGCKVKKMLIKKNPKEVKKNPEIREDEINPDLRKYFEINHNLSPPYNVILDTNFVNMSLRRKLDIEKELISCLFSRVNMFVTDCVIAEMEKLGKVHTLALKVLKSGRYKRLTCDHPGIYADNCLIDRVERHPCYVIATCDKELKQRLRKIPGVPILAVHGMKYSVESLPATGIFKF